MGEGQEKEVEIKTQQEKQEINVNKDEQKISNQFHVNAEQSKSVNEQVKEEIPVAQIDIKAVRSALQTDKDEAMKEMGKSKSFHKMSSTAEERKRILKSNDTLSMSEEQKKQYIKEYKEWQKREEETRRLEEIEEEERKRFKLDAICINLLHDDEEASEYFLEVQRKVGAYWRYSQKIDEDGLEYMRRFNEAKTALKNYYDTHRGFRWSSKGRRRKEYIKELLEYMNEIEEKEAEKIQKAQDRKANHNSTDEKTKRHMKEVAEHMQITPLITFDKEKYMEIAKKGTVREKVKARYELAELLMRKNFNSDLIEKKNIKFDEIYLNQVIAVIDESMEGSRMQKAEAADLAMSMYNRQCDEMIETYEKYLKEAPEGENAKAYAMVKTYNDFYIKRFVNHSFEADITSDVGIDYFAHSGDYKEKHPKRKEIEELDRVIYTSSISEYESQLKPETLADMDTSMRYVKKEEMQNMLKMKELFSNSEKEPLNDKEIDEVLERMTIEQKRDKLSIIYEKLEEIPENESEEQKEDRRKRQTALVQKIVGHDGVNYVSYNIAASRYNNEEYMNNSLKNVKWEKRYKEYSNRINNRVLEPRIYTVFLNGYKKNKDNLHGINETEEEKRKADEIFADDYFSGQLERRKKYLDQYLNEFMNIKLTEEMFQDDYLEKNYEKFVRIGQIVTLFQNIFVYDELNKEYFETLPESVKSRVKIINKLDYIGMLLPYAGALHGVPEKSDEVSNGTYENKEAIKTYKNIFAGFMEEAKKGKQFEILTEMAAKPMTVEGEIERVKNQTKTAQDKAGHSEVNYISYQIAMWQQNQNNLWKNSRDQIEWDKKVEKYNQNKGEKQVMDPRMYTIFLDGDIQHDTKFMDDYTSGDLEKRRPYLNQYLNEFINLKVPQEITEPGYIENNYGQIYRIGQLFAFFEKIFKEEINQKYFETLPQTVKDRINQIRKFSAMAMWTGSVGGSYGVPQILEHSDVFLSEQDTINKRSTVSFFEETLKTNKEIENLKKITATPMDVEEEIKKGNAE